MLDEKSIFDGITEDDLNPFVQEKDSLDDVKNLNTFKNAPILEFPEPVLLDDGRYDCYITEPNNVLKKMISEGSGIHPERLGVVKIHYLARVLDGDQFDNSYEREPSSFKVGSGDVIKGWDVAVVSMKVGEKAEFEIKPEFCVGGESSFLTTPPDTTLIFIIELLECENLPKTFDESIVYATHRKEEGNDLVKGGHWKEANNFYETGLSFVHYLEGKTSDEKLRQKEITLSILLNRSLCYLKLMKWKELYLVCNEAITLDPQNVKALFRRGVGYKQQGRTEFALRDLKKALDLAPTDAAIQREYDELVKTETLRREEQKKRDEIDKRRYKNLFERVEEEKVREKKMEREKEEKEKNKEKEEKEREKNEMKEIEEKEKEKENEIEKKKEGVKGQGEEKEKEEEKKGQEQEKEKIRLNENEKGKEEENENNKTREEDIVNKPNEENK